MHHDLALLVTITMAVLTALIGGYGARRLGLPSIAGYLIAGLVIGPFTPGFVGDTGAISQLAEMGVIFMMFGVGLHFSLKDLWNVRNIAVPGAVLQTTLSTLLGLGLALLWGWSVNAGLVLGLSLSIASTVVLLRGLEDNGHLNTSHGKVAIGWLVFEDLATVGILVLMPVLLGGSGNTFESIILALVKTAIFIVIMLFAGARLTPWILDRIAHTRSRELFILAVLALALGIALVSAELFGVSLALGAFLAGVVVSESELSHQVGAEILPFRDIFAVLFFVSVGMLVNPAVVLANFGQVLELSALIIIGKTVFTFLLSFILPASGRTLLVVAAGLSQIGEFSFIVGQTGISLNVLTQEQYGLILAGALISIVINPFMFRLIPVAERVLQKYPVLWKRMEKGGPTPSAPPKGMRDHVVLVGYGRVGTQIVQVLKYLGLSYLVVEQDAERASDLQKEGVHALFGDAANSEILTHANLDAAQALVVTVPNETTAELIVVAAHDLAPNLPIVARAGTQAGILRLMKHGANHVIQPELEGGLEIVRHTLLALNYPMLQIQTYVDSVRHDAYETIHNDEDQHEMLDKLVRAVRGVEIGWHAISAASPVVGQSLAEANIRNVIGASIVALMRENKVIPNPKSDTQLLEGDMVGLIGNAEQVEAAGKLLSP